ncbi:unnamed protein product [Fusarium graminearum]|uniref:Uncharacterized protein n=1 Tax=Gibberella zeae TaxID=5518 RepID=A0A4U9EK89_GIBZA|nr:unnamed protein product [Fusarium graminearum]CAF3606321.1 unnamed protein product [Fusarium graminearum]CAF3644703.1 unnamed protein product [Fusarium graminearum]CAG1968161.1 unnamed protein product [Fusarium graminearum]CAG1974200.1 unnamed protein product [Fusarium graminearum]
MGIGPRTHMGRELILSGLVLHQLVEVLQLASDKVQVHTIVRIFQHGSWNYGRWTVASVGFLRKP